MDPVHVAIRVEAAIGEKITQFSSALRRILRPLALRQGDGRMPFHKGQKLPSTSLLPLAISSMTRPRLAQVVKEIEAESLASTPYTCTRRRSSADMLVERIAALRMKFPSEMQRRNGRGVTVQKVLEEVCLPRHIEYLLNGPRGLALATPRAGSLYGTIAAEACANSLKALFRNVRHCILRTAVARVKCFSFVRVLSTYLATQLPAHMRRLPVASNIRALLGELRTDMKFHPRINASVRMSPQKPDLMGKNAKILRKRPSASAPRKRPSASAPRRRPSASTLRKRPASAM
jgi:hypothetical protein